MRDLSGETHGYWKVTGFSHKQPAKQTHGRKTASWVYFWNCVCTAPKGDGICGVERPVCSTNLRREKGSTNCGCQHPRNHKHGMSKHPAWNSWHAMRDRCNNPNCAMYYLYGGRGIRVCDRWNGSFEAFWQDTGDTWFEGASADRYPNNEDGHYEPGNFRWATTQEQADNRRTNYVFDTPWGRLNISQAAKLSGIPRNTIYSRKLYGYADEYLLLPVGQDHDEQGRFTFKSSGEQLVLPLVQKADAD